MSFGAAAQDRSRRPLGPAAACPCGSGAAYGSCCGPVLDGDVAVTAEALMRSRYTAFALGDAAYLIRSWHPRTRPDGLELDADTVWERLEISHTDEAGERGVVAFRAHWRQGRERGVLSETSRFRRVRGEWRYLDGLEG